MKYQALLGSSDTKSLSSVSSIGTATAVENDETQVFSVLRTLLPLRSDARRGAPAGRQQQRIFSRAARRIHDLDSNQAFSDRRKQAIVRARKDHSPPGGGGELLPGWLPRYQASYIGGCRVRFLGAVYREREREREKEREREREHAHHVRTRAHTLLGQGCQGSITIAG